MHFNHDWVPYEQRGAWLLEADLGVSAHPAHLETRFAYRTRIADYLWAGLPVVTSAGDVLGDHVATRGLGRAVPPGDDLAFAHACTELLADPGPARVAVAAAADELRWDRVVQPLLRLLPFRRKTRTQSAQGACHTQRHHRPICTDRHLRPCPPTAPPSSRASSRRTRGAR